MRIIAMCNQKGGVGKTTLTRELGCYLAHAGERALLIDADGQANLTKSFFENEPERGLYEAILDG
ncbi:ParA-like membrane-associated ATPase, partial [Olavius algarvensis spirochete endosymbiont]|uniref:ParA family protein n=1 Tax=Olavius algarvensis spirochete endosymbiont TaxID=260710 RepID=UPI000F0EBF1A